jgi:multiple antibiotic resistance protein
MSKTQIGLSPECGQKIRIYAKLSAALALILFASSAAAQEVLQSSAGEPRSVTFTFGKMFTFLFLTLGPLKVIGPFAKATRGRERAIKRKLAWQSILIALIALLIAATMGENILRKWNVSIGALMMTAGLLLFLVALKPILEQFSGREEPAPSTETGPLISPMALAFPTIVTPYGIAILIVLMSLRSSDQSAMSVMAVALVILALDWIAMLFAHRILKTPLVPVALGIVGAVLGVLQVALGVQAVVGALNLLGFRG